MQREIKFRGKHIHTIPGNEHLDGMWMYGYLSDNRYINSPAYEGEFLVDEDTIGQYTGLKDKNGKEIYQKDILQYWLEYDIKMHKAIVEWDNEYAMFILRTIKEPDFKPKTGLGLIIAEICGQKDVEIIGSVFDNPELLQEVEK